jgi:hypothetical protein
VLKTLDLGLFARLIRFVSVTSVSRASVSRTQPADITGASIIKELKDRGEIDADATVADVSYKDTDLIEDPTPDTSGFDTLSWDIPEWE